MANASYELTHSNVACTQHVLILMPVLLPILIPTHVPALILILILVQILRQIIIYVQTLIL